MVNIAAKYHPKGKPTEKQDPKNIKMCRHPYLSDSQLFHTVKTTIKGYSEGIWDTDTIMTIKQMTLKKLVQNVFKARGSVLEEIKFDMSFILIIF